MTTSSTPSNNTLVMTAIVSTVATLAAAKILYENVKQGKVRKERYRWVQEEIEIQDKEERQDAMKSFFSHFSDLQLEYHSTIEEANKRRTHKYYEMARESHKYDLVPSIRSYPRLRLKREVEMERIYRFRGANKSHRTVIVMCDEATSTLLDQARREILEPLQYSHDITTTKVWIPKANIIPPDHLHVTVAIPWWWHGMREGNYELSQELCARFRQSLIEEFHHCFQLELERIVLLGGKVLVALWRTVGERKGPDGYTIFDRHGETQDPVVKLRRDIVRCFTSEQNTWGQQPLTYSHRYSEETKTATPRESTGVGGRPKLKRSNTIELKTPGLGDHDGFIHTTLARLPIDCLSMTDVELEPVHRLCREATATYCGHRMVVSKFRFLETTGIGGESDPVEQPIFDEVVAAPTKVAIGSMGDIQNLLDLHAIKNVDRCATIGNLPPTHSPKLSIFDGLFDGPNGIKPEEIHSAMEDLMPPPRPKAVGVN